MSVVARLRCPYCQTLLNPGAFVCHGCGAVRGQRTISWLAILLGFPLLAFCIALFVGGIFGAPAFPPAFLAIWVGAIVLHVLDRKRIQWARGAAAGSMIIEEGIPQGRIESAEDKLCPQCAETVKRAAKVCRHCGFTFEAPASSGPQMIDVSPGAGSASARAAGDGAGGYRRESYRMPELDDQPPALPPPPPTFWQSWGGYAVPAGVAVVLVVLYLLRPPSAPPVEAAKTSPSPPTAPAAVAVSAPSSPPSNRGVALPSLGPIMLDRTQIGAVQKQLAGLGYDVGGADGTVGPKTRAAVKAFRQAAGLSGEALDTDLLAAVEDAAAKKRLEGMIGPAPRR